MSIKTLQVNIANIRKKFAGVSVPLPGIRNELGVDYDLDRCFQEFNAPNRPLRYHMCSLSTSDIVVTTKNGKETAYYVDSIGFKDVSHLLPELHEVEAQHQKEQVQDEPER